MTQLLLPPPLILWMCLLIDTKALNLHNGRWSRRDVLISSATAAVTSSPAAHAAATTRRTGPNDGNLVDLPSEAVRSYLQYRIPLQTAADFYVFELQQLLKNPSDYGEVNDLFRVSSGRGAQGNPSRIEREFTNAFRIVGLSMPPETADKMRDAQFGFERAMATISKTTAGIRRDLPIELDKNIVPTVLVGWEEGRQSINDFFAALNEVTGLEEMKSIPAQGPKQFAEYGRSERRYVELKKKIKLCQNRGGPSLSQAWGGADG